MRRRVSHRGLLASDAARPCSSDARLGWWRAHGVHEARGRPPHSHIAEPWRWVPGALDFAEKTALRGGARCLWAAIVRKERRRRRRGQRERHSKTWWSPRSPAMGGGRGVKSVILGQGAGQSCALHATPSEIHRYSAYTAQQVPARPQEVVRSIKAVMQEELRPAVGISRCACVSGEAMGAARAISNFRKHWRLMAFKMLVPQSVYARAVLQPALTLPSLSILNALFCQVHRASRNTSLLSCR